MVRGSTGAARRFRFIWGLARLIAGTFYRVERLGGELPHGPVLLVANHPNALMDPAIVAATAGRPVRFLAKSTLFTNPLLGVLMRWAQAIPVYRRKDEGADVSKNLEMFAAVQAALEQGDVVCLFPEGVSHASGRLEPLRTGAARIALACATAGGRVAIVPTGLNYDHRARFRSRCTAAYGRAFHGDDLAGTADEPAAIRALTERIAAALRTVIVEADPRTEAEVVWRIDELLRSARGMAGASAGEDRLQRQRRIALGMAQLRDRDPARYEALRETVRSYDARLARFGLRPRDVHLSVSPRIAFVFTARELLWLAVLGPICLAGLVLFAAPYALTDWIVRARHDALEMRGTITAVVGLAVYGVWTLLLSGIVGGRAGPLAGVATLVLIPLIAVAALFAIEREASVFRLVRAYWAVRRLGASRTVLARRQAQIANVLEQTREWLAASQGEGPRPG